MKFGIDFGGKNSKLDWVNFFTSLFEFDLILIFNPILQYWLSQIYFEKILIHLGLKWLLMENTDCGLEATVMGWRFLHGLGNNVDGVNRWGFDGVCLLASDFFDLVG